METRKLLVFVCISPSDTDSIYAAISPVVTNLGGGGGGGATKSTFSLGILSLLMVFHTRPASPPTYSRKNRPLFRRAVPLGFSCWTSDLL